MCTLVERNHHAHCFLSSHQSLRSPNKNNITLMNLLLITSGSIWTIATAKKIPELKAFSNERHRSLFRHFPLYTLRKYYYMYYHSIGRKPNITPRQKKVKAADSLAARYFISLNGLYNNIKQRYNKQHFRNIFFEINFKRSFYFSSKWNLTLSSWRVVNFNWGRDSCSLSSCRGSSEFPRPMSCCRLYVLFRL